jgi:hypothetical protein
MPGVTRSPAHKFVTLLGAVAGAYALAAWLGRSYGSTARERAAPLPGDAIVSRPHVVTDHAITIHAPANAVWPWLVQMGWHRAGWYTARWVDRLLFPENRPSEDRIVPELQAIQAGDFIPDGPPETGCGFIVEHVEPGRSLVLHSTSHLPAAWRRRHHVSLDWSWSFVLTVIDDGRTRFAFRSRWRTSPWWVTAAGRLLIVPADFVMSRAMLHGVKQRAEGAVGTVSGPAVTSALPHPSS